MDNFKNTRGSTFEKAGLVMTYGMMDKIPEIKAKDRKSLNSRIGGRFADGDLPGILVGDSGYPLQPWLITPLRDPQGNAERNYNRAHCRTRVTIEQLNGQLKNKFRCLMGQGIQMSAPRACNIMIACAVLFNIAKDLKEPEQVIEVEPDEVPHHPADQNQLTGIALRAELINNYFS
eukprot:XP_011662290.1 PREDICTED: putative nuclease HARBI1 [Strongylocentrotus purpuratus]